MQPLLETIRVATSDGATADQKQAGAMACRTLLAALEAQPGAPLGAQIPLGAAMPTSPLAMLGQLDIDQVLDLVITKLRERVPTGASAPVAYPFPPLKLPGAGP